MHLIPMKVGNLHFLGFLNVLVVNKTKLIFYDVVSSNFITDVKSFR
jgi:hypothetical protein